jgi:hypothetical protein
MPQKAKGLPRSCVVGALFLGLFGALLLAGCSRTPSPLGSSTAAPGQSAAARALSPSSVLRSAATPGLFEPYVLDLTWISEQTGWILAAVPCGGAVCPQIAKTLDDGRTWRVLPTPPGRAGCVQESCVSRLAFADASTGYLFGPGLFRTTDGGRHWTHEAALSVEALIAGPRQVVRVTYADAGCPGPCDRTVDETSPGSPIWHTVLALHTTSMGLPEGGAQLIGQGSAVYLPIYGDIAAGAGTQRATVLRSVDAGAHWQRLADPCAAVGHAPYVAIDFAAAPDGFLAVLCSPRGQQGPPFVLTSTDHGSLWGPRHLVPPNESNLGLIAAATPDRLVLATAPISGTGPVTYRVLASGDGGVDWSVAATEDEQIPPGAPPAAYLSFTDANVGWWVGFPRSIWTSHDGGLVWQGLPRFMVGLGCFGPGSRQPFAHRGADG